MDDKEEPDDEDSSENKPKPALKIKQSPRNPPARRDESREKDEDGDEEDDQDQVKLLSRFDYTDIYAKQSFLCLKKLKLSKEAFLKLTLDYCIYHWFVSRKTYWRLREPKGEAPTAGKHH